MYRWSIRMRSKDPRGLAGEWGKFIRRYGQPRVIEHLKVFSGVSREADLDQPFKAPSALPDALRGEEVYWMLLEGYVPIDDVDFDVAGDNLARFEALDLGEVDFCVQPVYM